MDLHGLPQGELFLFLPILTDFSTLYYLHAPIVRQIIIVLSLVDVNRLALGATCNGFLVRLALRNALSLRLALGVNYMLLAS
jgi:hypothetical protein